MSDTDPSIPEQQQPSPRPLFVEAANAPTLPTFDRSRPPAAEELPLLMTPAQVAVVFGISVEAARNDGNRNRLGEPTQIDGRSHYKREDVVRRWHERFGAKPEKAGANAGERANVRANEIQAANELVVRAIAAIERIAEGGGSQGEAAAILARTVEAQQQEIRRLTEALETEREKANNRPRTFWSRLFGG